MSLTTLANYRRVAFVCIIALIACFFVFSITREPSQKALALLLTTLPLAIPIKGTLSGKVYTIAYSSLLSTWYFCLSGWLYIIHDDWARWLMLTATILSLLWFIMCLVHNKHFKPKKNKKKRRA